MSGVETKFKGAFYEVLLSVSHVPELNTIEEKEDGLQVGAAVTLNTLKQKLSDIIERLPGQYITHDIVYTHIRTLDSGSNHYWS